MARSNNNPPSPPKVTDLLIRQKTEAMIEYGYVCLRQFPTFERHVLAAEIRNRMWTLLHLIVLAHKRYHKRTTLQDLDAQLDLLRAQARLIQQRVVDAIRARYSVDDEIKLLRIAPSAKTDAWNAYVEDCRAWGRAERAKLGL
jgi:hypothetical protein